MQPSYRWAAGPSGKVTVAPDFRAASLPAKLPKGAAANPATNNGTFELPKPVVRSPRAYRPRDVAKDPAPTPGQETLYRCRKAGKVEKSSARDAHHQHYCVAAAFHSCTSWLYPRRHQRLCVQSGALRCHPLQSEYRHNAAMFLPDLQLP